MRKQLRPAKLSGVVFFFNLFSVSSVLAPSELSDGLPPQILGSGFWSYQHGGNNGKTVKSQKKNKPASFDHAGNSLLVWQASGKSVHLVLGGRFQRSAWGPGCRSERQAAFYQTPLACWRDGLIKTNQVAPWQINTVNLTQLQLTLLIVSALTDSGLGGLCCQQPCRCQVWVLCYFPLNFIRLQLKVQL